MRILKKKLAREETVHPKRLLTPDSQCQRTAPQKVLCKFNCQLIYYKYPQLYRKLATIVNYQLSPNAEDGFGSVNAQKLLQPDFAPITDMMPSAARTFVALALANNCVDTGEVPHPPDSRLNSRPNEDSEDGELKDMRAVRTSVAKMISRCSEDVPIARPLLDRRRGSADK